jgi:ATP-dependent protease Clp ATPase subunit
LEKVFSFGSSLFLFYEFQNTESHYILQCQLIFTDSGLRAIAQKALKKKTGARGIHHILVSRLGSAE